MMTVSSEDGAHRFYLLQNIAWKGEDGMGPLTGTSLGHAKELQDLGLVRLEDFGDGPVATITDQGCREAGVVKEE